MSPSLEVLQSTNKKKLYILHLLKAVATLRIKQYHQHQRFHQLLCTSVQYKHITNISTVIAHSRRASALLHWRAFINHAQSLEGYRHASFPTTKEVGEDELAERPP